MSIVHTADSRGRTELGWLSARHTFSFADYRDEQRVRFGLLRVLNDDTIFAGGGFGMHPHANMEIVTVTLSGELRHVDSMGNEQRIGMDDVQIMSAGSGLTHSEYNASDVDPVNLLQIWVFPKQRNVEPRYEQRTFAPDERDNRWQNLVSPAGSEGGLSINQDAWFWRGDFVAGSAVTYERKRAENGVYVFVIDGAIEVEGENLTARDGLAIENRSEIEIQVVRDSQLLVIDVPLSRQRSPSP